MASKDKELKKSRKAHADVAKKYNAERVVTKKLKSDGAKLSAAVIATSDRIHNRSAKMAGRSVKAAAGKAIPYVGILVIGAMTASEVKAVCEMLEDVDKLRDLANPGSSKKEEVQEVCTIPIPTRQELVKAVRSSPGVAWQQAKEVLPSLQDAKEIDWSAYGTSMTTSLSSAATWTGETASGVYDATVVGVSGAYGATADGVAGALDWLFGEEEAEGTAEEVSEYLGLRGTPQAQSPRRLPKSGPETPVLPQKLPQTP